MKKKAKVKSKGKAKAKGKAKGRAKARTSPKRPATKVRSARKAGAVKGGQSPAASQVTPSDGEQSIGLLLPAVQKVRE